MGSYNIPNTTDVANEDEAHYEDVNGDNGDNGVNDACVPFALMWLYKNFDCVYELCGDLC
jgi:hypothetical protein